MTRSPKSSGSLSDRRARAGTITPETHRGRSTTVGMIGMVASHQSRGSVVIKNANFFGWYDRDGIGNSDDGTRSRSSSRDGVQPGRRARFETDLMSVQEDSDEESSSGESDSSTGPDAI